MKLSLIFCRKICPTQKSDMSYTKIRHILHDIFKVPFNFVENLIPRMFKLCRIDILCSELLPALLEKPDVCAHRKSSYPQRGIIGALKIIISAYFSYLSDYLQIKLKDKPCKLSFRFLNHDLRIINHDLHTVHA